jgi:hypothetical protein
LFYTILVSKRIKKINAENTKKEGTAYITGGTNAC